MGIWQRLRERDERTLDNLGIGGLLLGALGCMLRLFDADTRLSWAWSGLLMASCVAVVAVLLRRRARRGRDVTTERATRRQSSK